MTESQQERRVFHRVVFQRPLSIQQGQQSFAATLLDISLKGALVQNTDWLPGVGDLAKIAFELGDVETFSIEAEVRVAHVEKDHIGLEITGIDLQSVSHLRRLVELNLADPRCLERDLECLIKGP